MTTSRARTTLLFLPLLIPSSIAAQTAAVSQPSHSFEVISIRENVNGGQRRFEPTHSGFRATNLSLLVAIAAAYPPSSGARAFGPQNIQGLPEWTRDTHYDVNATIGDADLSVWQDPKLQPELLRTMLQSMLRERFMLAAHHQTKEESVYSLVVAPGGSKFQPTDPTKPHPPGRRLPWGDGGIMAPEANDRTIHFYDMPISSLAFMLSDLAPYPVQDDTGLTGRYDFAMKHPARMSADVTDPADAGRDPGPTIFSALSELGLKLVRVKRPVETLVIDHIEKPSEN
jgi:bla regulator protein blaR1